MERDLSQPFLDFEAARADARERAEHVETAPEALEVIVNVAQAAADALHRITVDAVQRGYITRRHAGEIIDRHPITIGRWVTAAAAEAETSDES